MSVPARLIFLLCVLTLAACGTNIDPAPTPTRETPLDTRIVAHVPQADAPALWIGANIGVAAWIGSDEAGVHIDARSFSPDSDELAPVVVLPLPPNRPTALSLYAAPRRSENTRVRALWLDSDDSDTTQLYTAVISGVDDGNLQVERGPVRISDRPVLRYAAAVDAFGTLWTVWSGVPSMSAYEPSLFLQAIDGDGRAQPPIPLPSNAAWFTLTTDTDGSLLLFWIEGMRIHLRRLENGVTQYVVNLTSTIALSAVDRLTDFRAAVDQTHRYLFWNVERFIDNAVVSETWWASDSHDNHWSTPARLTITVDGNTLNVRRAAPARSNIIPESLSVALDTDAGLFAGNFRAGTLSDTRPLNVTPTLIGSMNALRLDDTLFVAWADAESPDAAALTLMRTAN